MSNKPTPIISPEKANDITRTFSGLHASLEEDGKDPVRMVRGSLPIFHADGTYSHVSYQRPMSKREVERERRQTIKTANLPVRQGPGGPVALLRSLWKTLVFWRER
jgi:hypothetical protein